MIRLLFDFDLVYYIYCVKMGMSERGFWGGSLSKIMTLIDIYIDEKNMEAVEEYESKHFTVPTLSSMKELEGFCDGSI